MIITKHASRRWTERFPDQALKYQFENSKRMSKAKLKRLSFFLNRSTFPRNRTDYIKYYYLISPCNAVFVMTEPDKIVTVYELPEKE